MPRVLNLYTKFFIMFVLGGFFKLKWVIVFSFSWNCRFVSWVVSKAGDCSRGGPEGSLFDSYNTEVYGMAPLLSLDCSTLPLILNLQCWVLNKAASSTIFRVFSMTRPGIEPWSLGPLANTLTIMPNSKVLLFQFIISQSNLTFSIS